MLAEWKLWRDENSRLSDETCRELINQARELPLVEARIGTDRTVNEEVRCRKLRWISRDQCREIHDFVKERIERANRDLFGVDIQYLPDLQFTEYPRGCGHYERHQDLFLDGRARDRKLRCVIQLSDPSRYEGGDLRLETHSHPDPDRLRVRGRMIVFPSFIYHSVTPVMRGTRYRLVSWMEGNKWR